MTVALPSEEDGVYSVIGYAFDAPSDERTVHVDRFGGDVVATYGFSDYPLLAKAVSQGIGLHEGRSLGPVSFWGAALMCLGVMFLCASGPTMWWRRRPRRTAALGAPRGRMPLQATPLLVAGLVVLGCCCRSSASRCCSCWRWTSWCCGGCPGCGSGSARRPDVPQGRRLSGAPAGLIGRPPASRGPSAGSAEEDRHV